MKAEKKANGRIKITADKGKAKEKRIEALEQAEKKRNPNFEPGKPDSIGK